MINFNYSLNKSDYNAMNALFWGNCIIHAEKAAAAKGIARLAHGVIAALEFLPVIGQIASLIELIVVKTLAITKVDELASTVISTALLKSAEKMIENKNWENLIDLIQGYPGLARKRLEERPGAPTLLFLLSMSNACDNTASCKGACQIIFENSDWTQRDTEFGNTPFLCAVAYGNRHLIKYMFEYIENHPELTPMFTSVNALQNGDCCNTPLLMAVKNGNQDIACRLVAYYSSKDLMHYENQGHTALHLASYLKLNRVVEAIIFASYIVGCNEEILRQKSAKGFTALELYTKPHIRPFINRNYWDHDFIYKYMEAIGKHLFNFDLHSDQVIDHKICKELEPKNPHFSVEQSPFASCFYTDDQLRILWLHRRPFSE